jgi:hypothetical protein
MRKHTRPVGHANFATTVWAQLRNVRGLKSCIWRDIISCKVDLGAEGQSLYSKSLGWLLYFQASETNRLRQMPIASHRSCVRRQARTSD